MLLYSKTKIVHKTIQDPAGPHRPNTNITTCFPLSQASHMLYFHIWMHLSVWMHLCRQGESSPPPPKILPINDFWGLESLSSASILRQGSMHLSEVTGLGRGLNRQNNGCRVNSTTSSWFFQLPERCEGGGELTPFAPLPFSPRRASPTSFLSVNELVDRQTNVKTQK